MRTVSTIFALLISAFASLPVQAGDNAPSTLDSITKSARDMVPSMPSVSLPSMPDLTLPDLTDPSGRLMAEFNSFTQQVGDALPLLEQMGYEVTTFKVTWALPPRARLRLKSNGSTDPQKVSAIVAKTPSSGVLVSALISSAVTAKRIQSSMKLGTAFLDVDFAVPPRVNMKFVSAKDSGKDDVRDLDDLEFACRN